MKLILFLLMIISAVLLGLVIAYLYLRWLADKNKGLRNEPRVMPLPEKHPPVDFTPAAALSNQRTKALAAPSDAQFDETTSPSGASGKPAGIKDDLKRITGIGPKLERTLNANGIVSFRQIADWQDADIEANDKLLPGFHGRIRRDDWVGQAKQLSK